MKLLILLILLFTLTVYADETHTEIVYHVECYGLATAAQLPIVNHARHIRRYIPTHADYIKLQFTIMTSIVNLNTSQMSDTDLYNMMLDSDYNKNLAGDMYLLKCGGL